MSQKKKQKTGSSSDENQWLEWLHELSEEELSDIADSDEEDSVNESEHDSSTEQEASENELSEEEEIATNEDDYYVGKDGITKWRKNKFPANVRTRSCNIITHLPGPKCEARDRKNEIEIFALFFDDNMLRTIVTCTNIYIDKIRGNFSRERDAKHTDVLEIQAFIGILYLIGALRCSRKNLSKLWDNSMGNGLESCYLTMSENRFRFLLRCLRFDDVRDRGHRKELDKLAPIRELIELFNNNCQKYFSPSEYLTVDEQLLAFRGNCPFRQYIPSKPAKYGLKVFALVDVKTAYTMNLEPYVGKQPAILVRMSFSV